MKTNFKIAAVTLAAFVVGMTVNNVAVSAGTTTAVPAGFKVAIVDVPKVVEASPQVKRLKEDRKKKMDDLVASVEKAKSDISKESDATKRKALEEKYTKELNDKQEKINKEYAKQLEDIDKSISATIGTQAKKDGYDLVLAKSIVLFGGNNITDAVAKVVK